MEARDVAPSHAHPFQISLRIRHPSIDPDSISRELKVEPEHCFCAGDPRESGSGSALTAVHAESYWLGSLSAVTAATSLAGFAGSRIRAARERMQATPTESLTLALDASASSFLRSHAEFIRKLQDEGEVSLLIELSTHALTGFTFSCQFSRVLSELGISVEFDFVAS